MARNDVAPLAFYLLDDPQHVGREQFCGCIRVTQTQTFGSIFAMLSLRTTL
jgi:hypothetical protein